MLFEVGTWHRQSGNSANFRPLPPEKYRTQPAAAYSSTTRARNAVHPAALIDSNGSPFSPLVVGADNATLQYFARPRTAPLLVYFRRQAAFFGHSPRNMKILRGRTVIGVRGDWSQPSFWTTKRAGTSLLENHTSMIMGRIMGRRRVRSKRNLLRVSRTSALMLAHSEMPRSAQKSSVSRTRALASSISSSASRT